MFLKLIVICAVLFFNFEINETASNWKCVASDKAEIDQLVAKIMTYNWEERNFPKNQAELRPYCRDTMAMLTRADDYKRQCLTGEAKQFVSLFLYSVRQSFNSYCKHPNSRKTIEFYNSADCINSAFKSYSKCRRIYSEILQVIETTDFDSKQKLPQLCCGYFKSLECIREKTTAKRGCKASDAETMTDFLNGVYEDAINALCREYNEDSDKCEQVKLVKVGQNRNATDQKQPLLFNQAVHVFTNL